MKKSKMLMKTLAVLMLLSTAGSAFADPWFSHNNRYSYNNQRGCGSNGISRGLRSGALTRPEAMRLRQDARSINRFQRVAYSDGYISPAERARLNRMQNQYNRTFYREVRDGQRRW